MIHFRPRRNDFLLLEQEEGEAPKVPYTAPTERLLTTPDVSDSLSEKEASVDQKIDSYLMQYEKEAVPLETKEVGLFERRKTDRQLFKYLFEQEDPAAGADAGADAGGDMGGGGGETPEPGAEAPVAPVPKINIRKFAEGVARLVYNYKALIDPQTIILNRAMYYIAKNYSPRLAKEFMSILQRDFDLTPKTKTSRQQGNPEAPAQAIAGPDNGGGVPAGSGGGGGD